MKTILNKKGVFLMCLRFLQKSVLKLLDRTVYLRGTLFYDCSSSHTSELFVPYMVGSSDLPNPHQFSVSVVKY